VEGVFSPRRGVYEFFGRQFTLVNRAVYLKGTYPVIPSLDITAEYQRPEIKTRLRITGPLDNPAVDLESEPDYPRDEILARTMFGTSATGLTPLQTAQLGFAVASTARRGGSTFDFMGRTRHRLRVDELGFRESAQDPNQVELVAGRYVSDRLFLEYSQRMGRDRGGGVRAEYEINRHLSIETNGGAQMRPGVRLNIKQDY
jgi:translocation and assembly module TamB